MNGQSAPGMGAYVDLHWAVVRTDTTLNATPRIGHDLRFVPFALLGAMGGLALFRRMTHQQFQLAVGLLLGASGFGLLARTF